MTKCRPSSSRKGFSRVSPDVNMSPPFLRSQQRAEKKSEEAQDRNPGAKSGTNVSQNRAETAAINVSKLVVSLPPEPSSSDKETGSGSGKSLDKPSSQIPAKKYPESILISCDYN